MCWSKNVSLGMTFIGLLFTYYSYYKIDKIWALNVFYFTLMQIIHYIGYLFINDCNHPVNKMMAYLNYIHISFQPVIFLLGFNTLFKKLNIINEKDYNYINNYIYFGIVIGILLISRLFPIVIDKDRSYKLERKGCVWCGVPCSFSGNKHISFSIPLRNTPQYLTPTMFMHFALFYIPFILLLNKKVTFFMLLIFLSSLIPSLLFKINPAETGTIWCSISIIQWIVSFLLLKNIKI